MASALPFQVLIWSIPLCLLRDVPLMALMTRRQEGRVLRVTGWAALLNLGLNMLLIPRWGIVGAAGATVLTEGVRMLFALWYTRREGFPVPGFPRFWRAGLAGFTMAGLLLLIGRPALWISIPAGAAVYGITLALVGGISWRGKRPELTV